MGNWEKCVEKILKFLLKNINKKNLGIKVKIDQFCFKLKMWYREVSHFDNIVVFFSPKRWCKKVKIKNS